MEQAMFEIKIESKTAMGTLDRVARGTHDASPLMRSIATEFFSQTEANFAVEGRPKWLGLKNPPERRKGGMILQDTGQLAGSISISHDATSATVGSNKVYAAIHQLGGKTKPHIIRPRNKKALAFGGHVVKQVNHPGSNIPARPFLPVDAQGNIQPEAEQNILSLANNYLASVIGS
jgi:phage virion morphogenesis protein